MYINNGQYTEASTNLNKVLRKYPTSHCKSNQHEELYCNQGIP